MFQKFVNSTAALFLSAHFSSADTFQMLDTELVSCIDGAFRSINMPYGPQKNQKYGVLERSAEVAEGIHAVARMQVQLPKRHDTSISFNFSAQVIHSVEISNRPRIVSEYVHAQSVGITFNRELEIAKITQSGRRAEWLLSSIYGYQELMPSNHEPQYDSIQRRNLDLWIDNTVNTLAFTTSLCYADQEYLVPDGKDVLQPDFSKLEQLAYTIE